MQGRSTASLVERDRDLVELCRYVVLNPVRAGMVRSARKYHWNSYRATAGLRVPPGLLCTAWTLAQFGAARAAAQRRYRRFVEEMRATLTRARRRQEVPRQQRYADRPTLAALFGSSPPLEKAARDRLISQATSSTAML